MTGLRAVAKAWLNDLDTCRDGVAVTRLENRARRVTVSRLARPRVAALLKRPGMV